MTTKIVEPAKTPATSFRHLREVLLRASDAARAQYDVVRDEHRQVRKAFSSFEQSMLRMEKQLVGVGTRHEALAKALKEILVTRRHGVRTCWDEWSRLFEQRHKDLKHFSVMLFGRTMVGKSTTLEALAGGDGARIGDGVPDFTRRIDSVEWEGLRVVDTPGIEGFSPETIDVAESFIDRADMVAFVISDDHIEPKLLERLVALLNRQKPLLILFNIKAGNLDRLLQNPSRVFRPVEIDGHTRRIRGYLQQALAKGTVFIDPESVPIIPYCAEAANAARNYADLTDDARQTLFGASRFADVVNSIVKTVLERGVSIRAIAAYESFMTNLEQIEDGLRIELARVLAQARAVQASTTACAELFEDLENEGRQEFLVLQEHFFSVDAKIDALVDRVIDERASNPKSEFDLLLDMPAVQAKVQSIGARSMDAMAARIGEFQRQSKLDFNLAACLALGEFVTDAEVDADNLVWADVKKWSGKWGKIVGVPVVGTIAGAATTWAVVNWWNPSGWVAAGVALLAVGIGSAVTGAVAQAVQDSGKRDIEQARAELRKKLRGQCADIRERRVVKPSLKWLATEVGKAKQGVEEGLATLNQELDNFIAAAGEFVTAMEGARNCAALHSINAVLPLVISDWDVGECEVVAAARRISYRYKVAVRGKNGQSAAGRLIGRGGATIRRLSSHFSGQSIDVVDIGASISMADMVRAALFPARLKDAEVQIVTEEGQPRPLARVYAPCEDDAKHACGKHKWNLRLAEAILKCKIHVHPSRRN